MASVLEKADQLTEDILARIESKEISELAAGCLKTAFERQSVRLDVKHAQTKE